MKEYPKIETLFERDQETFMVDPTKIKNESIPLISKWHVTEKIDGTNIRVHLNEDGTMEVGGRTDAAQIHNELVKYLYATFTAEKMKALWKPDKEGVITPYSITLFGEGYGPGIQKGGGSYRKDKAFRLFDVLVKDEFWLSWANVEDIADKLGIKTVPFLGYWTLDEIVDRVKAGIVSKTSLEEGSADLQAEGVVGRTPVPLFDAKGERLIIKLKTKDFSKGRR